MKRKNVANELVAAMREAAAIAKGDAKPAAVHSYPFPLEVDVRSVRAATGLSRAEFARRFALDPRALQDWEQGRRRPDRATCGGANRSLFARISFVASYPCARKKRKDRKPESKNLDALHFPLLASGPLQDFVNDIFSNDLDSSLVGRHQRQNGHLSVSLSW